MSAFSLEVTAKQALEMAPVADQFPAGLPVAVACLPGETDADRRRAVAAVRALGFEPVPHLSARLTASADELDCTLAGYAAEAGVRQVFVVAGDLPQPRGPYADTLALIRSGLLERHGITEVGITGYPQGHPSIAPAALMQALLDKHEELGRRGLACSITTQFGFEPQVPPAWIGELRARGIESPVRVGVAGPASATTLLRYAAACGVRASAGVLAKYGLSITKLLSGGDGPQDYLRALRQALQPGHGAVSIHLYPFGGLRRTAEWLGTGVLEPEGDTAVLAPTR